MAAPVGSLNDGVKAWLGSVRLTEASTLPHSQSWRSAWNSAAAWSSSVLEDKGWDTLLRQIRNLAVYRMKARTDEDRGQQQLFRELESQILRLEEEILPRAYRKDRSK